ncbi:MAG: D-alanyl-D-alanine carboxypeptidase [Ottowia sp.]|nr:D-alanyl-D-alanine carboxypeptidase [Ottowia sp.]
MTATLTYCYRSIYIFIVLCCALLSPSTQAKNNPSKPSTLPSKIKQALAQAKIPEGALSLYIQAVDETTPRLNWRAEQAMNPASTMKLVTTWAGLRLLGPNYRWRTTFYADQLPVNGVLRGPIYVQGNGDPKLIPEEMEKIMLTLRQMGITTMDGDLVLDKSQFVTTSISQTIEVA